MVQETRRGLASAGRASGGATGLTLEDIATMYKRAPQMDGEAVSEPLAVGTQAPEFTPRGANTDPSSLSDFRGGWWFWSSIHPTGVQRARISSRCTSRSS